MSKIIQEHDKERAWKMYKEGKNITEIAKSIKRPYFTTWVLTKGRERGFSSLGKYLDHQIQQRGFKKRSKYNNCLARQKGFENYGKYQEDLARLKGFENNTKYLENLAKKKRFKNLSKYYEGRAKKRGFKKLGEYQEHLAKQNGFENYTKYQKHVQEHLAKQNGFENRGEYNKHLAKKRSEKEINKAISNLINFKLEKIGQNQTWLAKRIRVPPQYISLYVKGEVIPKEKRLNLLLNSLDIKKKPKDLDDLLEIIKNELNPNILY